MPRGADRLTGVRVPDPRPSPPRYENVPRGVVVGTRRGVCRWEMQPRCSRDVAEMCRGVAEAWRGCGGDVACSSGEASRRGGGVERCSHPTCVHPAFPSRHCKSRRSQVCQVCGVLGLCLLAPPPPCVCGEVYLTCLRRLERAAANETVAQRTRTTLTCCMLHVQGHVQDTSCRSRSGRRPF